MALLLKQSAIGKYRLSLFQIVTAHHKAYASCRWQNRVHYLVVGDGRNVMCGECAYGN